jgi:hypothetical protein
MFRVQNLKATGPMNEPGSNDISMIFPHFFKRFLGANYPARAIDEGCAIKDCPAKLIWSLI